MKLRIWKSLTFFIGLILFVAAFGVLLIAGSIFNPPPYRIVIALEDIEPYTVITRDALAVDEQTMNQRVASHLVHEAARGSAALSPGVRRRPAGVEWVATTSASGLDAVESAAG